MLVWQNYKTDLGRAYPMFALDGKVVGDKPTNIDPINLLPKSISLELIDVEYPCAVDGLTPRFLILWTIDGGQFQLNYPQPFSQNLFEFLTLNTDVAAFEFVGERLKYGRLKRMLDNARS